MAQDLLTTLRNLSFLNDVADSHLEALASVASVKDYPPGAVVFREGQKEQPLHLIVEGEVSLEFCAPGAGCKPFQTVGAGELLGWSPLLHLGAMTATARVLEPTKAVLIDAKQLGALFEQNPRFGYEFMCRVALVLSQRLSATRLQLIDICSELSPVASKHGDDG